MAKVFVQVAGKGEASQVEGMTTVGDVKAKFGLTSYVATVNGEPAVDSYELADFEVVSLSAAVKGGQQ